MCDRVKHAAIIVFIQLHLKCDAMTIFIRCCGGQSVVEFMETVLFTTKPASVQRVRVIRQGLLPKKNSCCLDGVMEREATNILLTLSWGTLALANSI